MTTPYHNRDPVSGFRQPIAYKISGVYGGFFLYVGIVLPFWALWLAEVGLSPGEIGFLIGFPSFLKIISSPFIAQQCDKWGMTRRPMLGLLALAILFFCGYFFFIGFSFFALVTLFFSVALTGFIPLIESYAVRACDRHHLQYGRLRSVGSIFFVMVSVGFGHYLDHYGYDNFLYFGVGSLVLTFLAVFLLPRDQRPPPRQSPDPEVKAVSPLKFLFSSREFVMFLVVLSLIQMSHGFIYVMGSVYWHDQGIDNQTIGALWSVGVIAEIGVFIFAGRIIARFRPMYVLGVIAVFGVIRWLALAVSLSVPLLFLAQSLHGLTYGAAHLVAMYYLSSRVPDQYFTTAQSLYSSVPLGLAQGTVMLLAGPMYEQAGGAAYYVMAALCFAVLFIARFVRRVAKDANSVA